MTGDHPALAPMRYQSAQRARDAARYAMEAASARLTIAEIDERIAEIDSQHEPLATIMAMHIPERDKLLAVALYIRTGRFPTQQKEAT